MDMLVYAGLLMVALFALSLSRAPAMLWVLALVVAALVHLPAPHPSMALFSGNSQLVWPLLALAGLALIFALSPLRRLFVTDRIFGLMRKSMPKISKTEQAALEAGTVGWDRQLFSGKPDWSQLEAVLPVILTDEERAFLDGPTEELCTMLNDWQIRHELRDLPEEVWTFLAKHKFFGMLIGKEHGGLGFSAQAQSLILGKIGSRSADAVVAVMVPNSLGPGELVTKYGTDEQKQYYLPRLADGREIPCFALTAPHSGSDAADMRDIGIIAKGEHNGEQVTGIRLTFDKRYITLAPRATVVGLAFRLIDPDGLLGDTEERGITLALIPASHKGVNIGRRHLPSGTAFPNGPVSGKDVFIPLDWIIGGKEGIGQGWRMLMESLSAGRAISLPATSTSAVKGVLRVTSAYARIRKQFNIPIGRMEGVEEPLARLCENAYVCESARAVTASMVSAGERPAVISALLKYQSTERMRAALRDGMDIHGGRAIIDGPSNYLQGGYQMIPVSITVEGANILTRTLMAFGQGALRAHPFLLKEVQALADPDPEVGRRAFDEAFCGHVKFMLGNYAGALLHNLTGGLFARAPHNGENTAYWYRQLYRGSRNFALVGDLAVATLGGALKRKQKISGRLADAMSELYLLSCVLKRYDDDGAHKDEWLLVDLCARNSIYRFYQALDEVLHNLPNRLVASLLRPAVFPLGRRFRPAPDYIGHKVVAEVLNPGEYRDRLTRDIYISRDETDITGRLEVTMEKIVAAEEASYYLERAIKQGRVRRAHGFDWIGDAARLYIIDAREAEQLRELEALVDKVIAVDDFDPAEVVPHYRRAGTQVIARAAEDAAVGNGAAEPEGDPVNVKAADRFEQPKSKPRGEKPVQTS